MSLFSKFFSSLIVGTGLGAGPYGIALSLGGGTPAPLEMFSPNEFSEFGETCLADETICEILKEEDYEDDTESQETARYEVSEDLLQAQYDDFCAWGFKFEEYNTLDICTPDKKTTESQSKR